MARRGPTEAQRRAMAIEAAQRMVARGERPGYHFRAIGESPGIDVTIIELPWIRNLATRPMYVREIAQTAIVEDLGVPPESFDLERLE